MSDDANEHIVSLRLWATRFECDPERSKYDMEELRAAADFIERQQAEIELLTLKPGLISLDFDPPYQISYDAKYLHG